MFADWEATRHGEAQEIRMQTLAMQQMQLAQMQQAQMHQQLQPQQSGQFPQGQPQTQSLQNQPGYTEQISQQGQMPPVPPPSPDQGQ